MLALLAELNAALANGVACTHCIVVETRGSTPQKAGAAMLVYPDGRQSGTLGGGCVEAEVKRLALQAVHERTTPELHTFCLDNDYGWDDGLICGGRMTILAQPLRATPSVRTDVVAYYQQLFDLMNRGQGYTEVVAISDAAGGTVGDRYLFDAQNRPVASLAESPQWDLISPHLLPLAQRPKPTTRQGWAFIPVPPRITLLIVGGGHVGQAVAQLAAQVDFDIWVLDDRDRYVSPERFPMASRRLVGDIGTTLRNLVPTLTPQTYAIIVTRGHNHDEEALYHLCRSACGYVGMIGSKRKIRMIFDDLVAQGIPAAVLASVHAPLGYNIGSQTVPEIAISIVAELIACRNVGSSTAARWSWQPRRAMDEEGP
ncbi:MAG: XdhC family protein [Gemmata sp.]|nr:XdhC family protein [Gemmata sp.]